MAAPKLLPTAGSSSLAGFGRILVATDFGLDADRALRRAARLPLAPEATLIIVHALPGSVPRSTLAVVVGAAEVALDSARTKLVALLKRRDRGDVTVRTRIVHGHAATEIGRTASSVGADLVVVGRGGSRLRRRFLGTTAQHVVRTARVPVLLVRRNPIGWYRRVLLGFDFSPDALRAARLANRMAGAPDSRVIALHVFPDPRAELTPTLSRAVGRAKWRAFMPTLAAESTRLRKVLAMVDSTRRWFLSLRGGDPRIRLLHAIGSSRADLVVVGTRGRRGLPRLLLGSVAETVLNESSCDALIVPRRLARP